MPRGKGHARFEWLAFWGDFYNELHAPSHSSYRVPTKNGGWRGIIMRLWFQRRKERLMSISTHVGWWWHIAQIFVRSNTRGWFRDLRIHWDAIQFKERQPRSRFSSAWPDTVTYINGEKMPVLQARNTWLYITLHHLVRGTSHSLAAARL